MDHYLFAGLELGPVLYERLARTVPQRLWDQRVEADRFTLREVLAHMADWEPIFQARMQQAMSEPGSMITAYDESQRAIDLNYGSAKVEASLQAFRQERTATVALLRSICPEQWTQAAIHPERGPMTLASLAAMVLGHDTYHVEQFTDYLERTALGKT